MHSPFGVMGAFLEVFLHFLSLGTTSFGGPVVPLGYFHERFVQSERWLVEDSYADLVALYWLLSGPSSSQVSIDLGMDRLGWCLVEGMRRCPSWVGRRCSRNLWGEIRFYPAMAWLKRCLSRSLVSLFFMPTS